MTSTTFQFAVLRYYHDPVTQEFLNVGVVLYSKEARFVSALLNKRYGRASKAFDGITREHYVRMIASVENQLNKLSVQFKKPGLFDDYPESIEALLQRVLPPDDSSLKFGGYGGGVVENLDSELQRLYSRLVEKYEGKNSAESRRDDDVWHDYIKLFSNYQIIEHLETKELGTSQYTYTFAHAYKNDKWHPVEPVSFDMVDSNYILEKANKWIGRAAMLADSNEIGKMYFLLGKPRRPELLQAYENAAVNLATKISIPVEVVREEDSEEFVRSFAKLIELHETSTST